MKLKVSLIVLAMALGISGSLGFFRAYWSFKNQQSCVRPEDVGDQRLHDLAISSKARNVLIAADVFMAIPVGDPLLDELFKEPLAVDACFAETLYVKAANLGSSEALSRLGELYACSNLSFGAASRSGLKAVRKIMDGAPEKLSSQISIFSYLQNPLKCPKINYTGICQTPEVDTIQYKTKQSILCATG